MGLRMAPFSTHFKISDFAVKIVSNIVHSERVTSSKFQILVAVLVTRQCLNLDSKIFHRS